MRFVTFVLFVAALLFSSPTLSAQLSFPPGAVVDVTTWQGRMMLSVVVPVSPPDYTFVELHTPPASTRAPWPASMICWQVTTFDPRPCALGAWLALEHSSPTTPIRPWTHDSLWPSSAAAMHVFVPGVLLDLHRLRPDATTRWRFAYCAAGWQCPPVPCDPPAPQLVGAIFEIVWQPGG